MTEKMNSLPPHLRDTIQGHLHLILLRPVLVPILLPHQGLDFEFNWWGSDHLHCLRLSPDVDETKIIFDIHCDFQGLQKYFQDAGKLEFNVLVTGDQANNNDQENALSTGASIRHRPTKYQLRKKKEWKCGDYVGKFVISNLKLNTRGEYVDENNIFNSYGDHCGSVVVFMLFTDQKFTSKEKTVLATNLQPTCEEDTKMVNNLESGRCLSHDKIISPEIKHSKPRLSRETLSPRFVTSENHSKSPNISPEIKHSRLSRESLSPRFIPFEKENRSPKKVETNHIRTKVSPKNVGTNTIKMKMSPKKTGTNTMKTKVSPKKIGINNEKNKASPQKRGISRPPNKKIISMKPKFDQKVQTNSYNCPNLNESSLTSILSASSEPKMPFKQDFIISRLFSFVDSGAIFASDLPSLIQICQGRSPSIEFDSSHFQEETDSYNHSDRFQERLTQPALRNDEKECFSMMNKDKQPVNISGISYRSDLWQAEPSKVNPRVFDDNFLASLLFKEDVKGFDSTTVEKKDSDFRILEKKCIDSSKIVDEKDAKDLDDCLQSPNNNNNDTSSLLILGFHSIQFNKNQHFTDPAEMKHQHCTNKREAKKTAVRQRSKLCYFVEVFLEYEGMEQPHGSSLYISRQVGQDDVTFGSRQIFRLLEQTEPHESEGFLKFRISRRRLGNRLREGVGVGIVSLKQLQVSEEELTVVLPLWANSCDTHTSTMNNKRDHVKQEMPLGSLHLSAIFAIASGPNGVDWVVGEENDSAFAPESQSQYNINNINNINAYALPSSSPPQRLDKDKSDTYQSDQIPPHSVPDVRQHELVGASNESSFFIENTSSAVNFIPFKEDEMKFGMLRQEVHLEVLEANGLPLLRSKRTLQTFPPSSYIQTTVAEVSYQTQVVKCTSSPKWKFATDFELSPGDLKDTNFHLILKVLHCLEGFSPQQDDPMLGFATIETQFLWDTFLSVCGWIPVLNLEGEICGEVKVSLTPKRSRSWYNCPQKELVNLSLNDDMEFRKSQEDHTRERSPPKENRNISQPKLVAESHRPNQSSFHTPNSALQNNGDRPFSNDKRATSVPPAREEIKRVCFAASPEHSNVSLTSEDLDCETLSSEVMEIETRSPIDFPLKEIQPHRSAYQHQSQDVIQRPLNEEVNLSTKEIQHQPGEYQEQSEDVPQNPLQEINLRSPSAISHVTHASGAGFSLNVPPNSYDHDVIEGLQWSNNVHALDTPCVSYLDLGPVMASSVTTLQPNARTKATKIHKQRRNRMAANFNFLPKE